MPAAVALVKCRSYDRAEVEDGLARAVDLLGGVEPSPVGEGAFLLKPNFLFPARRERRVNTDPEIVRAAAQLFKGCGTRLLVGDSPGFGSASRVSRTCGLEEALDGCSAEIVEFDETVEVRGRAFQRIGLARASVEAGGIVNLAKLKTHGQMGLTMAVKNLFGCVPGLAKPRWHLKAGEDRKAFSRLLVDVAAALKVRLHILDAVIAMEGNGPGAGTSRKLGALLVASDPVALDRVACEIVGFPPASIGVFQAAREMEWGETELRKIEVLGDDPRSFAVKDFRPATPASLLATIPLPHSLTSRLRNVLTPSPVLFANLCRRCDRCRKICPAKAITLDDRGRPLIDRARCVRCMCCQEICPEGAIRVRRTIFSLKASRDLG